MLGTHLGLPSECSIHLANGSSTRHLKGLARNKEESRSHE